MKKLLLLSAAVGALSVSNAYAADAIVVQEPVAVVEQHAFKPWFIDAGVGAAFSNANALDFFNPIGTLFTDSEVSGDRIILGGVDKKDTSFAANAAVGYMFTPNFYGKASYRYFGKHDYNGYASFDGDDYEQDMKVRAQGVFVGAGYIHDLTDKFYLDASGEIGAAFLKSTATQGANLFPDEPGIFPSKTQTNFAGGLALGVGYRLTDNMDFTVTGSYHWLGDAKTGKTFNADYMNDGEYLKAKKIGIAGINAGIRVKF